MQFIYTSICLNNLRYELHKLHFQIFQDYSGLLWQGPKLLSVKKQQFLILYLNPCHKRPEQGVVHGFEIPTS